MGARSRWVLDSVWQIAETVKLGGHQRKTLEHFMCLRSRQELQKRARSIRSFILKNPCKNSRRSGDSRPRHLVYDEAAIFLTIFTIPLRKVMNTLDEIVLYGNLMKPFTKGRLVETKEKS